MGSMKRYLVKRLFHTLLILIGISAITFFLSRVAPSDPAALWVGPHARAEQVEQARRELGLDKPLLTQYFLYLRDLIRGDWGISFRTHRPVSEDIKTYLPASMELAIAGQLLASVIGIPLGVLAASKKDTKIDHANRLFGIASVSIPVFWLAMMLQILFFRILGVLPLAGRVSIETELFNPIARVTGFYLVDSLLTGNFSAFQDAFLHLILPAVAVASFSTGLALRMTRSTMIEILQEKYIVTARAFGIPENTIKFRYALKNAIIPTLMVLGIVFGWSLTGVFLIEVIFNWPGLGTYAWRAILAVDYPVVVAISIIAALIITVINLILDLILVYLDPRVGL